MLPLHLTVTTKTADNLTKTKKPPYRTGRDGRLFLSLQQRNAKTILAKYRSEPPLCVQRALYCEYDLPDMAYMYVASTSGGMLQGDKYQINFELDTNTKAHITTQGATRIYGTTHDYTQQATQKFQISLKENAYLEYIPDQIIPYANSKFSQDATITIHDTATMIYSETITSGRIGMGESFVYKSCNLKMQVANQNNKFRFLDAAKMTPQESSNISSFGIMNRYNITSSLYILTEQKHTPRLQREIEKIILHNNNKMIIGGAAIMHGKTGVLVRLLGNDNESVKYMVNKSVACARRIILDAPFTDVRKC